jgi:HSP20 family protein
MYMKTVSLYHPRSIESALNDFDRYLESFLGESTFNPTIGNYGNRPAVDILETNAAYLLEAELPGYSENKVQVHVDGRTLTIESKKENEKAGRNVSPGKEEEEKETAEPRFLIRERRNIPFSRSFQLPEDADLETITAEFKDGLLTLEIKKRASAQKRKIEINRT